MTITALPPKTATEWHSPASRPEEVAALIASVDRYNPNNIALLEDYLSTQIQSGQPDLFANLAILKLYQFNPTMANSKIVIDILLLSLTSEEKTVDAPDFNLALSLAMDRPPAPLVGYVQDSEDSQDEVAEVAEYLKRCRDLLRECRFRDFWKVWKEDSSEGAKREFEWWPRLFIATHY